MAICGLTPPLVSRRWALECEDTALGSSRLPTYGGKMLLLTPQGSGAHDTHISQL